MHSAIRYRSFHLALPIDELADHAKDAERRI
jgi:hypothetical protein